MRGHEDAVVVANPGSIPEMGQMASALASAGLLRAYVTPIATTERTAAALLRYLPQSLVGRMRRELRRRTVPAAIGDKQIMRTATLDELLFVAARRSPLPERAQVSFMRRRNAVFDKFLSQRLLATDAAVIGCYGASKLSLAKACGLGVESFLEYPIAHHLFAEKILREEARLQPEYAGTLQFHDFPERFRAQLEEEIELSDHVFVLSAFQKRTFVESGVDESKLLVTPLGVDLDLFRPQPRPEDGIFRVIFVGQITQRKGISYLFDAFERAAIPNSELLLVGNIVGTDAPWRNRPRVRYVSHLPRWELPAQYAAADAFVLPSLVEGFPQTALEAMACGKPVIVSENTFGEDVVTDGVDGFVVPIRDSDAITERLSYLHANPDVRQGMGTAARQRAEAFSWERYGERVVELVCRAVGNRVAEEIEHDEK